jgi:DNA replicative helicase MCM subunit Mcm2 (Cdc46/Mcm family)
VIEGEPLKETDRTKDWTDFLKARCRKQIGEIGREYPHLRSLYIDYKILEAYGSIGISLADELLENPGKVIEDIKDAIKNGNLIKTMDGKEPKGINIRFTNIPKKRLLRDLRYDDVGTIVAIEGAIVYRASEVQPRVIESVFRCPAGHFTHKLQSSHIKFVEPSSCATDGCTFKKLDLIPARSRFTDQQRLKIQDNSEGLKPGQQPMIIDGIVLDDICDSVYASERATFNAIVRATQRVISGEKSTIFDLHLEISSIDTGIRDFEEITWLPEDEAKIKELAKSGDALELISQSVAPSIWGATDIKKALTLQMFGGVEKIHASGQRERAEIHITLLGDFGCLIPGTLVTMSDGTQKRIESLKVSEQVLIDDGTSHEISDAISLTNKPLLRIRTGLGREVTVTPEHPLMTRNGWVRADHLSKGTEIKIVSSTPCTKEDYIKTQFDNSIFAQGKQMIVPEFITERIGLLYGLMVGDGTISKNKYRSAITVSEDEKELIPIITSLVKDIFGIGATVEEKKPSYRQEGTIGDRTFKRTKTIYQVVWNSKLLARFFDMEKQPVRTVPDCILSSRNSVVAAFLKGLFTSDGCIFYENKKGRTQHPYKIQIGSASHRLLLDIQILLLRWGINARIAGKNLVINKDEDIKKYILNIGFVVKHKQEKCLLALKQKLTRKARDTKEFVEIIDITPMGTGTVYDITVPDVHRFISDGVVSHNTAKTALGEYACLMNPRGVFISGPSASAPGLIGAVKQDPEEKGRWYVEPGELPMADLGVCCVDEIDKADKDTLNILYNVMQEGKVRISKAAKRTMNARTSMILLGNPKYQKFDPFADIVDQITIPPALMNRSDFVFIMIDNTNHDKEIANHILGANYYGECKSAGKEDKLTDAEKSAIVPALTPRLTKQWIAYAKNNVHPIMNPAAMAKIHAYYLKLRGGDFTEDPENKSSATPRQLQSLIRLCEAAARVRLSNEVTLKDVDTIIVIFDNCLKAVAMDPKTKKLDMGRIRGVSQNKINMIGVMREIMKAEPKLSLELLLSKMDDHGYKDRTSVILALEEAKRSGDVSEPRNEHYVWEGK